MSDLHPDLAQVAFLAGKWAGSGHGDYPTIEPFDYREEITFANPPRKPFLAYRQHTWSVVDGTPLHTESGYLRAGSGGSWELVIAQPSGFAEAYRGRLRDAVLEFETTSIAATPTAKSVERIRRTITVKGAELTYRVEMAAVDHPMQQHLSAILRRVVN